MEMEARPAGGIAAGEASRGAGISQGSPLPNTNAVILRSVGGRLVVCRDNIMAAAAVASRGRHVLCSTPFKGNGTHVPFAMKMLHDDTNA